MLKFIDLIFSILLLSLVFVTTANAKEVQHLNFSLLVFNGEQRQAYFEQVRSFEEKHPNIRVNIQAVASEEYKENIEKWLQAKSHSDVMFWFGGERLNWYVSRGWVRAIDELWSTFDWYHRLTQSSQSAVTRNGRIYGLPIHYYHWGLYFKKSLFAKYNITPPETWESFLAICAKLKAEGVTPISFGSEEIWPVAGWFDYLNLRINGLSFHQSLLDGNISYKDPRVLSVFSHWKMLIDQGYFLENHADMTWREALPYLYRNLAGMFLMGNFWTSQIPGSLRDDFSVFRFPRVTSDIAWFEEAPTDVLFIPENVVNFEAAQTFLNFMSQRNVQQSLNETLGMLAPQNEPPQKMDHFMEAGVAILKEAEGASQFYDRDNPKPIATEGMKQMQRFMQNPDDLPQVLDALEKLRNASFN